MRRIHLTVLALALLARPAGIRAEPPAPETAPPPAPETGPETVPETGPETVPETAPPAPSTTSEVAPPLTSDAAPDSAGAPAAERAARQRAQALFAEGGTLFEQWQFVHAEDKYREALTHWEHPLIYFYLGRTLEKQGHLEEAYEMLQRALHQGAASFPPEDRSLAEALQQTLESRLAQIEVHCEQSGAEVLVDGEPWFVAPGRQRKLIRPGQHVILARKHGYVTVAEAVSLLPGRQTRVAIHMYTDEVRIERRWQPWMPWGVAGGGAATALLGGLFLRQAGNDYAAFERAVDACEQALGCNQLPTRRRDSGARKEAIGTGLLLAGGAAVALGLAGVFLNQPRTYRSEPGDGATIELAPLISDNMAGLSTRIRF